MDSRESPQARRTLQVDSPSVQSHLTMLQGVVNRLAANSASCKTWCVSLVSALAVVAAQAAKVKLLLVAAFPILLFAALDAYYLGLERRFRACYESFAKKLHEGTARIDDVFVVAPRLRFRGLFVEAFQAFGSFSIWPFYLGLTAILWFLRRRLI
jgi:hypothetical protein